MNLGRPYYTSYVRDQSGATAIEYGLIIALMTLALVGALASTGSSNSDNWDGVAEDISNAHEGVR